MSSDVTQVLSPVPALEFVPDEGPGCFQTARAWAMLACGVVGFTVGVLASLALVALLMFG